MRMAPCCKCGQHNVNGFKKHNKWYSTCYNKECRFTTEVGMPTRKLSRYNWNLLYEKETGEVLPDEACGRQERAFMKKEIRAGLHKLIYCFTQEDFDKWSEQYDISQVDWVKAKGKKASAARKKAKIRAARLEAEAHE